MFWIWRSVWKEICSWVRKLFYCTSMGSLSMGYCGLTVSHNNSPVSEAGIWLLFENKWSQNTVWPREVVGGEKKKKSQKTVLNDEENERGCTESECEATTEDAPVCTVQWTVVCEVYIIALSCPEEISPTRLMKSDSSLISVCLLSSLLFCHDCFRLLEMSCLSMRAKKIMFVFIRFMHYTCAPSRCT